MVNGTFAAETNVEWEVFFSLEAVFEEVRKEGDEYLTYN